MSLADIHQCQPRPDQIADIGDRLQFAEFGLKLDDIFLADTTGGRRISIQVDRRLPGHPGQRIRDFTQPGLIGPATVEKADRRNRRKSHFRFRWFKFFGQYVGQVRGTRPFPIFGGLYGDTEFATLLEHLEPLDFIGDAPAL